ncbi:hypothetical protein, partial [Tenebrionicola larvae]
MQSVFHSGAALTGAANDSGSLSNASGRCFATLKSASGWQGVIPAKHKTCSRQEIAVAASQVMKVWRQS